GDGLVLDLLERADLLLGLGFDPVESDKLWHRALPLVSIAPLSIASGAFTPQHEAVGKVCATLAALGERSFGPFSWEPDVVSSFRARLQQALRPTARPRGLSAYELTRALRELFPRDTILTTDVGSIKSITTQAWTSFEPLTFFESNGLSAMGYSLP